MKNIWLLYTRVINERERGTQENDQFLLYIIKNDMWNNFDDIELFLDFVKKNNNLRRITIILFKRWSKKIK